MRSTVRMFDPGRELAEIGTEVEEAMRRVLASHRFILGPEVEAFEQEFATMLGVRHVVGVGNGFDALCLALRALGIGPGDEVLTVPNTAFATALAIVHVGAHPVFADVDEKTYLIDLEDAGRKVTPRTKAILPVDLFGAPPDGAALGAFADAHGLAIVEDACQAHGARDGDRQAGALGRAGAFSFYPTKNLGCFGDGGAVSTDDDAIADQVRLMRHYGQRTAYRHEALGINSRLDELQAAVLRVKLKHLDRWNGVRRRNAAIYRETLDRWDGLPAERKGQTHVYHQFVVRTRGRDALAKHLEASAIHTQVHYPVPLHLTEALADLGHGPGTCPVAERLANEVLSLPVHPFLTEDEVRRVAGAVRAFLAEEG